MWARPLKWPLRAKWRSSWGAPLFAGVHSCLLGTWQRARSFLTDRTAAQQWVLPMPGVWGLLAPQFSAVAPLLCSTCLGVALRCAHPPLASEI